MPDPAPGPAPGNMPDSRSLLRAIPHRPPFLLLDEIREITDRAILADKTLQADDELFSRVYAGHYPNSPITPGVLLCEMVFQAAAVLMARRLGIDADAQDQAGGDANDAGPGRVPVLTKIEEARFKHMVMPGDRVEVSVLLNEQVSNANYMQGTVKVMGRLAVRVKFVVALV